MPAKETVAQKAKNNYDEYMQKVGQYKDELSEVNKYKYKTTGRFRFSNNSPEIDVLAQTDELLLKNIWTILDNTPQVDWWLKDIDLEGLKEDIMNRKRRLYYPAEIKKLEEKMNRLLLLMDHEAKGEIELEKILNA